MLDFVCFLKMPRQFVGSSETERTQSRDENTTPVASTYASRAQFFWNCIQGLAQEQDDGEGFAPPKQRPSCSAVTDQNNYCNAPPKQATAE